MTTFHYFLDYRVRIIETARIDKSTKLPLYEVYYLTTKIKGNWVYSGEFPGYHVPNVFHKFFETSHFADFFQYKDEFFMVADEQEFCKFLYVRDLEEAGFKKRSYISETNRFYTGF